MSHTTVLLLLLLVLLVHSKKTVHLVPHTHDDIGWLKTVDQYQYGLNMSIFPAWVNAIISSAVGALLEDPARRFTYVEIGFFSRWWDQQTAAMQKNVRQLVAEDRLQFANGGWCMHDEAGTHFVDMIDQTTIGHRFLYRQFQKVPKVGWQIDPFGHSATQAALLSARTGFLATYHARVDYQDYQYRASTNRREFMWQASPSMPDQVTLGGVLLHKTYCSPDDFAWDIIDLVPEIAVNIQDNVIVDNPNSEQYNVPRTLQNFLNNANRDASITLGDNIMWTMGCDFNYMAGQSWFVNMDKLINLVRADGTYDIQYSTPYDYTVAKLAEGLDFDTKTDDFFPYAGAPHEFWTGYFTSRAALKRYVRQISKYWAASRQIQALGGVASGELPSISDALGIAQHHDAVAGTAKQHVAFDYAKRLSAGYADDQHRLSAASVVLFGAPVTHCPRSNVSECPGTAALALGKVVPVVVWNPQAFATTRTIEIPVPVSNVQALGSGAVSIVVASPTSVTNYGPNPDGLPYTIAVTVTLPPLGHVSFDLKPGSQVSAPQEEVDGQGVTLRSPSLELRFSDTTGFLDSITYLATNLTLPVTQDWCYFPSNVGDKESSQAGGAYIFRPVTNVTCTPLVAQTGSTKVLVASPMYSVVEQTFDFVTQRIILFNDSFDVEFTVHGIPIADGFGKELVARFRTGLKNQGVFYTDSNGRELQRRQVNHRNDYPFVQTEPHAGNYYPVDALFVMNDTSAQLNIFTDAAMGGGSWSDGEVHITTHRRLLADDSEGVSEPLNETEFVTSYEECSLLDFFLCGKHFGVPLIVRGRLTVSLLPSAGAMRQTRKELDAHFFEPLVLFPNASATSNSSFLAPGFPASLHLITMHYISSSVFVVRIGHRFAVDEDAVLSAPVTLDLRNIFVKTWNVASVNELSLMTTDITHVDVTQVTIGPMDIRAFQFLIA